MPRIVDGQKWGEWVFDADDLTLRSEAQLYCLDLRDIVDSNAMMDQIVLLSTRRWASEVTIGEFVTALDDIFDPQGALAANGRIDPREVIAAALF
jgi:hypothetical protein